MMRIVAAGASGFLGRPLVAHLRNAGHEVTQLVRRSPKEPGEQQWDPSTGEVRLPDGTDAVLNLCGAGVGDHRWTDSYRAVIRSSRIDPTKALVKAIRAQGVRTLVNASGIGAYGDRGDEPITEATPTEKESFLGRLSFDWESAAFEAAPARVVVLRTGLPLHRKGGLLQPMVLPFSLGLGGKLGNGKQWMPWVSLEDWIRAVAFAVTEDALSGPVNVAGPTPATNAEFTAEFGRILKRPTIMLLPRLPLRVVLGEFADEAFRLPRRAGSVDPGRFRLPSRDGRRGAGGRPQALTSSAAAGAAAVASLRRRRLRRRNQPPTPAIDVPTADQVAQFVKTWRIV